MDVDNVVRWIHVISGVAWLGEVLTINFVLFPALIKMKKGSRKVFIRQVFPSVFRLASVLSLTAIISGLTMSYLVTGWKDLDELIGTRWGIGILIGATLALLLTLFHFFVESHLEPMVIAQDEESEVDVDKVIAVLKVVPRVGLAVLIVIVLLMMYAARGL